MNAHNKSERTAMSETNVLQLIESVAKSNGLDFEAKPVNAVASTVVKLALSPAERQSIANLFPADSSARYMAISFTNKLPNLLNTLQNSTATLMVRDEFGHFVKGIAVGELFEVMLTANTLTLLAVAAQQQQLQRIDRKLDLISMKIDRILEFLYGDKKAELLSEISFAKYAYENYSSMSRHSEQRIATINSLQDGKKIAIKDIEFYISDMDSISQLDPKFPGELEKNAKQCLQICESIDMSIQLYTLNCLLEVYYADNMDPEYIEYLEDDIRSYVEKCDKRILSDLNILKARMTVGKIGIPGRGKAKEPIVNEIEGRIDTINNHKIGDKQKELLDALHSAGQKTKYLVSREGDVYIE